MVTDLFTACEIFPELFINNLFTYSIIRFFTLVIYLFRIFFRALDLVVIIYQEMFGTNGSLLNFKYQVYW